MIKYFRLLFVLFMVLGLGSLTLAQVPADWSVHPPDYEYVMTVTAILKVNNQMANESANVIAAFVGTECRGKAEPLLVNDLQMYFLMIYSNTNGETVTFKTYYSPLDTVLNNSGSLVFDGTAAFGTPDNPYELKATYTITIVGVVTENSPVEQAFKLKQNYPNPFNASTSIRYKIGEPGIINLTVYDLNGNQIEILYNKFQSVGDYCVEWGGENISSGFYFYVLTQNNRILTKSCIHLK